MSKIKTWMPLKFLVHVFRVHPEKINLKVMRKLTANLFPVCWSVDNRSRKERPKLMLATKIFFPYVHLHIFKANICYSSSQIKQIKCYFFLFYVLYNGRTGLFQSQNITGWYSHNKSVSFNVQYSLMYSSLSLTVTEPSKTTIKCFL